MIRPAFRDGQEQPIQRPARPASRGCSKLGVARDRSSLRISVLLAYMRSIIARPNAEHEISFAPSIRRAKS
jgi:hypothetical protein